MKITVVGTGYVGLVSGVCFSEIGNKVLCIDIDEQKVAKMKQGVSPIYEPGLEDLMKKNIANGRLDFSHDIRQGVEKADVIFIAVGTPPKANGEADLKFIEQVAEDIGKNMNGYKLIVTKSTVPIGTGQHIKKTIQENMKMPYEFDIASNPEFLREGTAVYDTLNMERAVIGVESKKAADTLKELHKPFNTTVVESNIETAEMIKYASNAFLATKISFINEIANICEKVGADVTRVAEGMGFDHRIGKAFLQAGLGYGGSCFPKDTNALIHIASNSDYDLRIIPEVEKVNFMQRERFLEKVFETFHNDMTNKKIGILGLSFKPNTDDMRAAPSIDIINALQKEGANVLAYDPVAGEQAKLQIPELKLATKLDEVFQDADSVILVTDWEEFKQMDISRLGSLMNQKVLFDGRNVFDLNKMDELGFYYVSIGRPVVGNN